jgi:hypothetical protein
MMRALTLPAWLDQPGEVPALFFLVSARSYGKLDQHPKKSSFRSFSPISQKPMVEKPCRLLIGAAAK